MKKFLFLLLLFAPTAALAAPDPCDSIILESKTVYPGAHPGPVSDTAAYLYVRMWITNKDSLSNVSLPFTQKSISGGAYLILGRPRNFDGMVNRLTNTLPSHLQTIYYWYRYSDSVTLSAFFDAADIPNTAEPPNEIRKPFWEIKFDSVPPNLGVVELDSIKILAVTVQFVNLLGQKVDVNFVKSTITVAAPKGDLNLDVSLGPSDVIFLLLAVYRGIPPPAGLAACDLNCDAEPTPADIVILLNMVFNEEQPPC